ncbi:hypothetical protein H4582DRAFT_1816282, partial [Lactarius indigo]
YRKWCQENKFESMLPDDTKECRQAALNKSLKTLQSSVTNHFKPQDESERPIPYSDKAFTCATIEWLIDADLPLQVFSQPSFKRMINIASCTTHSVKLPSPCQTRAHIIKTFKQQMCLLKERLNVHSFLFSLSYVNAHTYLLEPYCGWRNQPAMYCMSG